MKTHHRATRSVIFYGYDKCSTCRKAKQYLEAHGIEFNELDITQRPPPRKLLQAIIEAGSYTLAELFNRSGELYRSLKMREKMKTLSESQLLDLLAAHGKLVKRPLITDGARHTVGFDVERLKSAWVV